MGSADAPAPAAGAAEGPTVTATTTTTAETPAEGDGQGDVGVFGSDRPYGNVPSWESSGRSAESSSCSGNGAPPYALSIAPMV